MASSLRLSGRRIARSLPSPLVQSQQRAYAVQAAAQTADFSVSSTQEGIKVATLDEGLPTSAITVAVKAGSRYESQPGLSHVLKNFVFKNTNKRSALRIIRETELLGGVLSSSLTREHLFLTAECMRGDEAYFAEILGDVLIQSKFAAHEYHEEVVPSVAVEYEQAIQSPDVLALDLAHQLAFRRGLGNSLFATPHLHVDLHSVVGYGRSVFAQPSNLAVLASGVEGGAFSNLVGEFFTGSSASASASSSAAARSATQSKYYGGEMRVAHTAHGGKELGSLLVAFEGGAQNAPEYAVLRTLLGGENSIKWTNGLSPLSKLTPLVGGQYKPAVKSFNLHYSDAGLLGFFVQAPTKQVGEIASGAVAALKAAAAGVKEEELKRAIAKTKFQAANVWKAESRGKSLLAHSSLNLAKSRRSRTHSHLLIKSQRSKCRKQPRPLSRASLP